MKYVLPGVPAPQGSKKCWCQDGRAVMKEQTERSLRPWRQAVAFAARVQHRGRDPFCVPVRVRLVFTLPKPKSPKFVCCPAVPPDLSKLARSTEDALTDAGVWQDDALVVAYDRLEKVYLGSADPEALPHPGGLLHITPH